MPDNAYDGDVPLTIATRGNHVESLHRGTVVVARADGAIDVSAGDPNQHTYMRSSAKPFQAMALVLTGTADRLGLTDADIAIACSSHSGEPAHVEAVQALLEKGGVPPDALRCGTHPPLNPQAARALIALGKEPTALHNNCSGKHAGMLVTSKCMRWPLDTYLDPAHALQKLNLETISVFTGEPREGIDIAVDGCGVPVFYVSVLGVAIAFARLATGSVIDASMAEAARVIRAAMVSYPFLVAGTDRFDTELLSAGNGGIVCKGGAQGGEGIGLVDSGQGIGIKITDGSGGSIGIVSVHLLDALGMLDAKSTDQLDQYRQSPIRNHVGVVAGENRVTLTLGGRAD